MKSLKSSSNWISRREFMRVSGVATAGLVAVACGAGGEPQEEMAAEPAADEAPAAEAAAPAASDSMYSEAPMLAEMVAAGDLPPVDERLPASPAVLEAVEQVGKYGGTIRRGFKGVSDRWGPTKMQNESLTWYNMDLTLRPNMVESWETNDDATMWTFNLREGLKWSDGSPFDSDSFTWWYENHFSNTDLSPAVSRRWGTGTPRVPMVVSAPDKTTVMMTFEHPKPLFAFDVTRSHCFSPGHYMKQFHIDLTDDKAALEAQIDEAGVDSWDQYYIDRNWWYLNPDRPNIGPWLSKNELSSELFLMERNPYFWQVDEEGQQLPYIDKVTHRLFDTNDVFNLRVINGEVDFQSRHIQTGNFTLYKENEDAGDYRVIIGTSTRHEVVTPNQGAQDPRVRELFQNRDVRIAMSLAVDREALNELVWDGLLTPRQYSPLDQSPQYYAKLTEAYAGYDPDRANQLLDDAGYAERDADGFRLWKDGSGETLSFIIEGTSQPGTPEEDSVLTIIKYYAEIGLKATYKGMERSLYTEHWSANTQDAVYWGGYRDLLPILTPSPWIGTELDRPWAGAFGRWKVDENDANGEPPPDGHFLWDIWAIWDQVSAEPDPATRDELFFQILDIWAEEIPIVGYLGQSPALIIMKNQMHNYIGGQPVNDGLEDEHFLNPQLLSWEDPENHM